MPVDFNNISGITTKADGEKAGSISNDKGVVAFLKTLTGYHKSVVER